MIKTGLIGNGYWGNIIKSKLDKLSNLQFIQNSTNYNPDHFFKADWIFVATPVKTHYSIAKDILLKGINVFIEKPFCLNLDQANDLFKIAERKNAKIFIDNVFLLRSELTSLKYNNYKSIKFKWFKNGPFHDTIINDLLYHDVYIIIFLLGEKKISKFSIIRNENDKLHIKFLYDDIEIEIDYNRVSNGPKEKIIILDNDLIRLSYTTEDPLLQIISSCLNGTANFKSNNLLNFSSTKIFLNFKKKLNK